MDVSNIKFFSKRLFGRRRTGRFSDDMVNRLFVEKSKLKHNPLMFITTNENIASGHSINGFYEGIVEDNSSDVFLDIKRSSSSLFPDARVSGDISEIDYVNVLVPLKDVFRIDIEPRVYSNPKNFETFLLEDCIF